MRYLLFGLLITVATSARAENPLDSEKRYRHALNSVSYVFSLGIWYKKCTGDQSDPEFVKRRDLAMLGIAGLSGDDISLGEDLIRSAAVKAKNDMERLMSGPEPCSDASKRLAMTSANKGLETIGGLLDQKDE